MGHPGGCPEGVWGPIRPPRGPKIDFPPPETDFGALWKKLIFGHFGPFSGQPNPLGTPIFALFGGQFSRKMSIFRQNMANFAILRCGNMFYSLGELQLWVFGENSPTSGRDTAILVIFGLILPQIWSEFGRFWRIFYEVCGSGPRFWSKMWYFYPLAPQKLSRAIIWPFDLIF